MSLSGTLLTPASVDGFPLLAGDRMPFCYGMDVNRRFYSFEAQAGRPAVLVLALQAAPTRTQALIEAFAERHDHFRTRNADVLLLADEDVVRAMPRGSSGNLPVRAIDCGAGFLTRCGAMPGELIVLVTDRNLRIAMVLAGDDPDIVANCLHCIDRLVFEEPRQVLLPAPVLMLPHLLSRELCGILIDKFEAGPSVDGGIARIGTDGLPHGCIDQGIKRRRDTQILPQDPLFSELRDALLRRCAPEIATAFQARVGYLDRILIARYDDSGGYFRRHRDNVAPNVAFREFAISVNLNAEEYEGGDLLFPEYNDHFYRPPTGAGLIFSASVLHEALPVTRGRRYVLLTFFHGETAELRRRSYEARPAATGASAHQPSP